MLCMSVVCGVVCVCVLYVVSCVSVCVVCVECVECGVHCAFVVWCVYGSGM